MNQDIDDEGAVACLMDESTGGLWLTLIMALTSDPSDPEHSVSKSALEAAYYYLRIGKPEHALKTVDNLVGTKDRLSFYISEGFVDEAMTLLLKIKSRYEVYRIMKANNWFKEGAKVALFYNDIEDHITFELLRIQEKLWSHDTLYTAIAKQQDIEKLQLLEEQTQDCYTKEQINYYIVALKNTVEDYNKIIDVSNSFMRSITFDAFLHAFMSDVQVVPIIKNLGFLLKIHKLHQHRLNYVDIQLKNFYHIKIFFHDRKYKCNFPPMMLQKLQVKRYETDVDGNVVMPLKQLKVVIHRHTKSIAKSWLKVLDELLGKNIQDIGAFKQYVQVKDKIQALRYCTNLISCKYYYEQFEISYAKDLDYCITKMMLINLLSLPWVCYMPKNHRNVEVFLHVPVIVQLFDQLNFSKEWAFQGSTKQFYDFKEFVEETIDYYSSKVLIDTAVASFISDLEIITIGLLAILSENKNYCLIVPQSYEVVTGWFNGINTRRVLSTQVLRKTSRSLKVEDILDYFLKIIKLLLGNNPFTSVLARTCTTEFPDHYPIQYQFERCFVLALTFFGNLAPLMEDDLKKLFQLNLQTIDKLSLTVKLNNTSHPRKFRCLINEAANAITTDELLNVIYKIQKLYSRKMVKFNLRSRKPLFEIVEPINFPSFHLYPHTTTIQYSKEEKIDDFSAELELTPKKSAFNAYKACTKKE